MCLYRKYNFDSNKSGCITLEKLFEEFHALQDVYESSDYYCFLTVYKSDGSTYLDFVPDSPRTVNYLCQTLPVDIRNKMEKPERLRFVLKCISSQDMKTTRSYNKVETLLDKIVIIK